MKNILTTLILSINIAVSFGQTSEKPNTSNAEIWLVQNGGRVNIHQDERITSLMNSLRENPAPLEGYRVQLSFGKKEEVNQLRVVFLQKYPDHAAYISYLQPNFRLRAGDFRTRLEAEQFKHLIIEDYPNCYIVTDYIELPNLSLGEQ